MGDLSKWPEPIHVIGAGGIGCQVILTLMELGARRVTLWDDDTVDAHNVPSQVLFRPSDVGRNKVDAVRDYLERQESGIVLETRPERVSALNRRNMRGIVISGVDSMKSRSAIWSCIVFNGWVDAYFDLRVGGDAFELHTPDHADEASVIRYGSWLFEDSDANDRGCATRERPYSAVAVSAELSIRLSRFMEGERAWDSVHRNLAHGIDVRQPAGA